MDKHFKWKHLEDLNFIAAMGAARGVRYDIDERFLARFFMFNVPPPDDDCLCDIYTTQLTGHLSSFAEKVKICARPLVEIMLSAFRVSGVLLLSKSWAYFYSFRGAYIISLSMNGFSTCLMINCSECKRN